MAAPRPSPFTLPAEPAARQARMIDLGIVGAALLAFIAALLPYYTVKASFMGISQSESANGWDAWPSILGAILILLGGAVFALIVFGFASAAQHETLRLASLGALAVGWILVLVSLFWYPLPGEVKELLDQLKSLGAGDVVKIGRSAGAWLTFIFSSAALAGAAYLFLRSRQAPTPQAPLPMPPPA